MDKSGRDFSIEGEIFCSSRDSFFHVEIRDFPIEVEIFISIPEFFFHVEIFYLKSRVFFHVQMFQFKSTFEMLPRIPCWHFLPKIKITR